jgi:hypothetical protein
MMTKLTAIAILVASIRLVLAEEAFQSGGFARAPEDALDIANTPAPLFRDPVFDGAADPSLVWHGLEKAWYIFYTQRRANQELPGVAWAFGTRIGIARSTDRGRTWTYVGTAEGMSRGMKEETFWAPHVFEDNGTFHMFVTFIPLIAERFGGGTPQILHYTSRNLVQWEFSDEVDVGSDKIIDPGLVKLRDGRWLMVFRDDRQKSMTAKVTSTDLKNWTRIEDLTGQGRHEAPVVLFWKDKFWLFIDEWKGIAVYQSDDGIQYARNNLILDRPGNRPDDGYFGSHPGVALAGDRAFIFYHCHAGKTIGTEVPPKDQNRPEYKRSSLQVAELELRDGKIVCERDKPDPGRWPAERAQAWYEKQPWPCGFNYVPANALSYTEMWMDYSFDPQLIDKELALAEGVGFNCLRVVLPFVVWEKEPEAFKKRLDTFLEICRKRGLKVMFALFDDCVFGPIKNPVFGKQPEVVPGWYANGWTPSPGHSLVRDASSWPRLEKYVKDLLGSFGRDQRVWVWDLYNEPTAGGVGDASIPLLAKVIEWARKTNPEQPLTVGFWNEKRELNDLIQANSDIITFHNYSPADQLGIQLENLLKLGRPVICTEWLNRGRKSLVAECLPVFRESRAGAMHWGLVNGKTQTHLNWGHRPDQPEPGTWQHDIFRPDHTPYDPQEIILFKQSIQRIP